jgi:hypothetical protein
MRKRQKNKLEKKQHGVISIVQSPDLGEVKGVNKNESGKVKKHGVISIVQTPGHE